MTSYQSRNEIQRGLHQMLPYQIEECQKCDKLPSSLEKLIRHNYQAKFVCYDKKSNCIEIGVEEHTSINSYPEITVKKIKLKDAVADLSKTLRSSDADLKFYGKILASSGSATEIDEVVLV